MKTNSYHLVEKRGSVKTYTVFLEKIDYTIHNPTPKKKRLCKDSNDYITNNLIKTI